MNIVTGWAGALIKSAEHTVSLKLLSRCPISEINGQTPCTPELSIHPDHSLTDTKRLNTAELKCKVIQFVVHLSLQMTAFTYK